MIPLIALEVILTNLLVSGICAVWFASFFLVANDFFRRQDFFGRQISFVYLAKPVHG